MPVDTGERWLLGQTVRLLGQHWPITQFKLGRSRPAPLGLVAAAQLGRNAVQWPRCIGQLPPAAPPTAIRVRRSLALKSFQVFELVSAILVIVFRHQFRPRIVAIFNA